MQMSVRGTVSASFQLRLKLHFNSAYTIFARLNFGYEELYQCNFWLDGFDC